MVNDTDSDNSLPGQIQNLELSLAKMGVDIDGVQASYLALLQSVAQVIDSNRPDNLPTDGASNGDGSVDGFDDGADEDTMQVARYAARFCEDCHAKIAMNADFKAKRAAVGKSMTAARYLKTPTAIKFCERKLFADGGKAVRNAPAAVAPISGDADTQKVQRFAESNAAFQHVLQLRGKTPADFAAGFAAAKKKNPKLTPAQYGVPEGGA
jgi:hypothetical protein